MAKAKKEQTNDIEKLEINKDEVVKEIKSAVKEQLLEEVTRKIDYESKKSLEQVEKKIYKYKNFSIFKRNIIILILLGVIIFETKTLYDNDLLFKGSKKNSDNDIVDKIDKDKDNNKEEQEQPEKDLEWYKENYGYLLDNIKTNLTGEDTYYLYSGNYNEDNIKNSVKLNMAYQLLSNEEKRVDSSVISVSEEAIKNKYKKIFGNIDNLKLENFNDNCIQFIYNPSNKNYMAIDTTCEALNEEIIKNIENIYEEDNKLIIEVLVGILNKDNNSLSNMNKELIKENYSNELLDEVKDKLNKYKYKFEKIEEEYYLKEINKD